MSSPTTTRSRPLSPNIQIYRPQLTSVLSILNRITGILLSACAVVLVVWLVAAARGPQTYAPVQAAMASRIGRIVLFGATFSFFLHLRQISCVFDAGKEQSEAVELIEAYLSRLTPMSFRHDPYDDPTRDRGEQR